MIDINNFKQVNDRLGHQEGDRMRKRFAELCKENIRAGLDYPFRVGGDEFVLLTQCEEATATRILARSFKYRFSYVTFELFLKELLK
jgi:diguanylate cyclase (GGDEF)-like protein